MNREFTREFRFERCIDRDAWVAVLTEHHWVKDEDGNEVDEWFRIFTEDGWVLLREGENYPTNLPMISGHDMWRAEERDRWAKGVANQFYDACDPSLRRKPDDWSAQAIPFGTTTDEQRTVAIAVEAS